MVDGELFDKLEEIGRILRNVKAPFGGIQLVLCGDFMQLPPGRLIINNTDCFNSLSRQNDQVCVRGQELADVRAHHDPAVARFPSERA